MTHVACVFGAAGDVGGDDRDPKTTLGTPERRALI